MERSHVLEVLVEHVLQHCQATLVNALAAWLFNARECVSATRQAVEHKQDPIAWIRNL